MSETKNEALLDINPPNLGYYDRDTHELIPKTMFACIKGGATTGIQMIADAYAERDALRAEVERLKAETITETDFREVLRREMVVEAERDKVACALAQTQRDLQEAAQAAKAWRAESHKRDKEISDLKLDLGMREAAPPAVLLVDAEAVAAACQAYAITIRREDQHHFFTPDKFEDIIRAHTRAVDREALAKAIRDSWRSSMGLDPRDASHPVDTTWLAHARACIAHLSLPSPGEIDREAVDVHQALGTAIEIIQEEMGEQDGIHRAEDRIAEYRAALYCPPLAGPAGTTNTGEVAATRKGADPEVDRGSIPPSPASPAPRKGGECETCEGSGYVSRTARPGRIGYGVKRCPACAGDELVESLKAQLADTKAEARKRLAVADERMNGPSVQALDAGGEKPSGGDFVCSKCGRPMREHTPSRADKGIDCPPLSPPTGPSDTEILVAWYDDGRINFPIGSEKERAARIRRLFASHRSPAAAVARPKKNVPGSVGYNVGWGDCAFAYEEALRAAGVPLAEEKA